MGLRGFAKDVIPPILLRAIRSKKSLMPVYRNYEEALRVCDTYEDDTLVKVVVAKGIQFKEAISKNKRIDLMSLRTLVGIAVALNKGELTVLDFGGAAGTHYTIARAFLSDSIKLKWCVVETEAMVNEVKSTGFESDELSFETSIENAQTRFGKFDLVFSSGALQYCPSPLHFFESLLRVDSTYVVVTRTALSKHSKEVVAIQKSDLATNGVGPIPSYLGISNRSVQYPVTFSPVESFVELINKYGRLIMTVDEDKAAYITSNGSFDMYGFVCRMK